MKRNLLLFLTFLFCFPLFSQELTSTDVSKKWGKVSPAELAMTSYAKDTSAKAVVLYQQCMSRYDYNSSVGFKVLSFVSEKIKILREEGKEEGTFSLPYYCQSNSEREVISNLDVYSYNLVDGKMVKTKMSKEYVFDEKTNSNYHRLKFSAPDIKAGTVIELKYERSNPYVFSLGDWELQRDIPVLVTDYQISIPEYFDYNIESKGYEPLGIKETSENQQFTLGFDSDGPQTVYCTTRIIRCNALDIPALRDETHVWCASDFKSGLRFELRGTRYPNTSYKAYTQTWEDLEKTLSDNDDYYSFSRTSNPWEAELTPILANIADEREKISKIFEFVKNHIRWNDEYYLIGDKSPKDAVKNGTGNNAQINFLLMSALKDAKIKCYPILISRRSRGRIPMTFPSLSELNTFIVAAETSEGKIYYMDGSATEGGLNMLPTELLVDRGRVYESGHENKWVDLTKLTRNNQMGTVGVKIDPNGMITGEMSCIYINLMASTYKSQFKKAKDSVDFVEKRQNELEISLDSFTVSGKEPISSIVNERICFHKQLDLSGDYLYLNPMIFVHMESNPFTQTERKLPVEFNHPYGFQIVCNIHIPDNYQVEELPKPVKYVLNEDKAVCQYWIEKTENGVQMKYVFQLNQIIFPQMDYPGIREFYGQVAAKNSEMLVLKKKTL
jgi:hypothetical protein